MALTAQQIQAAEAAQFVAARDQTNQVRLIAGPGTGKSRSIEERVRWLLASGTPPQRIHVVSFTRAASRDLEYRIQNYCNQNGQPGVARARVSTLHSLALRLLRAGGLLGAYPVGPFILDDWELENIIDAEFSRTCGRTPGRCSEIRRYYEAFWSTGQWGPPNYVPPTPPINVAERDSFTQFYGARSQVYSCIFPGEVIRRCLERIAAGLLDPVDLLGVRQLIVDEYQDLNPCDIEFVDSVINPVWRRSWLVMTTKASTRFALRPPQESSPF
jgi:superfamily I DNA/RNA helicase